MWLTDDVPSMEGPSTSADSSKLSPCMGRPNLRAVWGDLMADASCLYTPYTRP